MKSRKPVKKNDSENLPREFQLFLTEGVIESLLATKRDESGFVFFILDDEQKAISFGLMRLKDRFDEFLVTDSIAEMFKIVFLNPRLRIAPFQCVSAAEEETDLFSTCWSLNRATFGNVSSYVLVKEGIVEFCQIVHEEGIHYSEKVDHNLAEDSVLLTFEEEIKRIILILSKKGIRLQ